MLSRVAESLYWTARYVERAENTARFIDVSLQMGLDAPNVFDEQWEPLIAITGQREDFIARYERPTRENVIQFLTFDRENPSSIFSCIWRARENARSVREAISSEVWEQLNRFYLLVSSRAAGKRALTDSHDFFDEVKLLSHLIAGVADNTMSHNQAWHFLNLGRYLERADNTSRLADVKYFLLLPSVEYVGGAVDELQWSILLRSASAFEMYRKRHGRIAVASVVDFLLLDKEFPRAVLFCLLRAEESLHLISDTRPGTFHNVAERRLGRLTAELAYAQVYDIIASGLHEFFDELQTRLNAVGDALAESFFALQLDQSPRARAGGSESDILSRNQSQRGAGGDRGYARDRRE